MRVRLGGWAAAVAVAGLLLSACRPGSTRTAPPVDIDAPYVAAPAACVPLLPAGTTLEGRLGADQRVTAAVTCREPQPPPGAVVVRQVTGPALERLVAALRGASAAPRSVCDASGRVVPAFAVQLADGAWVAPQLPSDGCHPTDAVLHALTDAAR